MFSFTQTEPERALTISRWDVPVNRWLGVKFEQGLNDRLGATVSRMTEDSIYSGPMLEPKLANQLYGLPGLEFKEPINSDDAWLKHQRKRRELTRQSYFEAATHSAFSGKAAAGLGAQLIGGLLHPLDVGLMFLPVVGSMSRASSVAKLGGGPVRQAFARGLITEEALTASRIPFPKFTGAMIEGTVNQAAFEIPLAIQNYRDQANYTSLDAAFNILAGGAFAGGIHLGVKSVAGLFDGAAKLHRRLSPQTKEQMFLKAGTDFAENRDIDLRDYVELDDTAIQLKVEADQKADIERAIADSLEPEPGPTIRQQVERPFDVIDAIEGYVGGKISLENVRKFRETFEPTGAARDLFAASGQKLDDVLASLHAQGAFKRIDSEDELLEAILNAAEARKGFREDVRGERNLTAEQDRRTQLADAERQQRIDAITARKKAEHELARDKAIDVETLAEIRRQQAAGKILSDEQVARYQAKEQPTESDLAVIEDDIATIEADLLQYADRQISDNDLDLPPLYESREHAITAALPCVLEQLTTV